ncbi:MAG TPA: hypothetical protein VF753_03380 [Terriglobales bacterium]
MRLTDKARLVSSNFCCNFREFRPNQSKSENHAKRDIANIHAVFRDLKGNLQGHGGEGGILSEHPKKFSAVMVKRKSNRINGRFVEKPFCQCHWEI